MPDYYETRAQTDPAVIDIPFKFSATGKVASVRAYSAAAWKNKVTAILMTNRGSRVWYDRYGASLPDLLTFENVEFIAGQIKDAISTAFLRWIPEISLNDVLYNYDWNTSTMVITVIYVLPDGTEDSTSLTYQSTNTSNNIIQVG